ncbi:hypothetical protein F3G63_34980, partial [Pseudomonas aeruginosa]
SSYFSFPNQTLLRMPKCKKVFKESKEVPSPPFTRNYLTPKMLNKKVKGEGLKTLFYIYARQGKKSVFSFF